MNSSIHLINLINTKYQDVDNRWSIVYWKTLVVMNEYAYFEDETGIWKSMLFRLVVPK